jgi:DNA anti-recombination protein RmuC
MKTAKLFLAVVLACTVPVAGCVHVASTAGVPARNATPIEKALAYNAGLAEANKTIAQAVINANAQTPPLITAEYANKILSMQARVADLDRQLTPLLASASSVTANAAQIEQLLGQIKAAASGVQGDLGIKDAATQAKVTGAIGQVYQFADLALSALVAAGLLK